MTEHETLPERTDGEGLPTDAAAPAAQPTEVTAGPPEPTGATEPVPPAPITPAREPAPPTPKHGGVPLPAFVIVAVVAIAAMVMAVVFFLGKSSADDDRNEARQELATARSNLRDARANLGDARAQIDDLADEVSVLEEDLVTSEEIGTILGGLVTTGRDAADNLFACADLSRTFIVDFFETGIPDLAAAENADAACATAEESYDAFVDALAGLEPVAE